MTNTATKTYQVTVIERALAFYEVEAEDARTAAENWQDGEFKGRDDEALDTEGPSSVRERQPDGSWRKVPQSEWEADPPAGSMPDWIDPVRYARAWVRTARDVLAQPGRTADVDHLLELGLGQLAAALSVAGEVDSPTGNNPAKKPYSVLLLYPDYANDSGTETYYAWVEAQDAIEAVAMAQREALAANEWAEREPDDFAPLLVTEGHHHSEALFNK
jgi:hypothetical protein